MKGLLEDNCWFPRFVNELVVQQKSQFWIVVNDPCNLLQVFNKLLLLPCWRNMWLPRSQYINVFCYARASWDIQDSCMTDVVAGSSHPEPWCCHTITTVFHRGNLPVLPGVDISGCLDLFAGTLVLSDAANNTLTQFYCFTSASFPEASLRPQATYHQVSKCFWIGITQYWCCAVAFESKTLISRFCINKRLSLLERSGKRVGESPWDDRHDVDEVVKLTA